MNASQASEWRTVTKESSRTLVERAIKAAKLARIYNLTWLDALQRAKGANHATGRRGNKRLRSCYNARLTKGTPEASLDGRSYTRP